MPSLFAGIKNNTREVEEYAVVVEYSPSRFAGILLPPRIVGAGVAGSGRRQNDLCYSGIISLILLDNVPVECCSFRKLFLIL